MTPEDLAGLKRAVQSLTSEFCCTACQYDWTIELIEHALPPFAAGAITAATNKGLEAAMLVALRTLQRDP